MTKTAHSQNTTKLFLYNFFICFLILISLFLTSKMALVAGLTISLANAATYWLMHARHIGRVPDYAAQALVVVVTNTMMRFFIVSASFVWVLTQTELSATTVLLGFVIGQILFWINQLLMVVKNNGK